MADCHDDGHRFSGIVSSPLQYSSSHIAKFGAVMHSLLLQVEMHLLPHLLHRASLYISAAVPSLGLTGT